MVEHGRGPVLIDWSNARSGPATTDLAMSWLLLTTGAVDGPPWPVRTVAEFLAQVDHEAVAATLPRSPAGGSPTLPSGGPRPPGSERWPVSGPAGS